MNNKGFTLIELLIIVAIVGILAAIIIPQIGAYKEKHKKRSYRTEQTQTSQPSTSSQRCSCGCKCQ